MPTWSWRRSVKVSYSNVLYSKYTVCLLDCVLALIKSIFLTNAKGTDFTRCFAKHIGGNIMELRIIWNLFFTICIKVFELKLIYEDYQDCQVN